MFGGLWLLPDDAKSSSSSSASSSSVDDVPVLPSIDRVLAFAFHTHWRPLSALSAASTSDSGRAVLISPRIVSPLASWASDALGSAGAGSSSAGSALRFDLEAMLQLEGGGSGFGGDERAVQRALITGVYLQQIWHQVMKCM